MRCPPEFHSPEVRSEVKEPKKREHGACVMVTIATDRKLSREAISRFFSTILSLVFGVWSPEGALYHVRHPHGRPSWMICACVNAELMGGNFRVFSCIWTMVLDLDKGLQSFFKQVRRVYVFSEESVGYRKGVCP